MAEKGDALVFAYAGTINSGGMAQALKTIAEVLNRRGGRLLIYGPYSQASIHNGPLDQRNIEIMGLRPSGQLIDELREKADVMFLPMSFQDEDRANMEICFPSKLTDYTLTGLPLLIYGPPYCSGVRWAEGIPGVAEIVKCEDVAELDAAVARLAHDPCYRLKLASRSLEAGNQYFSHAAATAVFQKALMATPIAETVCARPRSILYGAKATHTS